MTISWLRTRVARPGLWAWCAAFGVAASFLLVSWGALAALRARDAMRAEARTLGASWDTTFVALERDFTRILETLPRSCDSATIRRLVSVSVASEVARTYHLQVAGGSVWCGPLGPDRAPDIPTIPASSHGPRLYFESTPRSSGLRTIEARDGARLIAELDPNVLSRISYRLWPGVARWDRGLQTAGADRVEWMNGPLRFARGRTVWERSAWSPSHRMRMTQTVTVGHVLSRLYDDLPVLLLATVALTVLLMSRLQSRVRDRANPQRRLELAIRKRRFEPYVQPIVAMQTGRCVGAEVLMRWKHPARGILPPMEFINLAEESRLIVPMSAMVMAKARDRLAPIIEQHRALYFSFNVTPAQLRSVGFDATLSRIFDDVSIPRQHVLLEVTERDFVDVTSEEALRRLRAAGYKLALDDFGTGQSSLAMIERMDIDRLKIDREFVRSIDESTVARPVLDTIIALAHSLQIPLIAEGVETAAQWDYLQARGVQYVQGYLVARPMPIDDFVRWIDRYHVDLPAPAPDGRPTPRHSPRIDLSGPVTLRESPEPMPKIDTERLVREMRGIDGVEVRDRMYRLRRYPQCFVASEAVAWIASRWSVSETAAVRVGERLTALGHIEHVESEHDFANDYLFFRFVVADAEVDGDARDAMPELDDVVRRMRSDAGLAVCAQRRYLLWYDACFTGRSLHAWLRREFDLTAASASGVAGALMLRGDVVHIFDDRPFEPTGELYRYR